MKKQHELLAAALAATVLAAPSTATAAGLALKDETERIGPGVTLRHLVTLSEIGWTDAQVLEVDLRARGRPYRPADRGSGRGWLALSAQVREAGAVAGVNGDFFDINNSNAAIGPEILGGAIRKSGIGRTQVAGVFEDRLGRLANLALEATATLPSGPRAVRSLNDPVDEGRTGKGLRVTYDFTQATATRSAGGVLRAQKTLPGQPLRASVWVKGDGNGQWVTISLRDAANKVIDLRPGYATGTEWTKFSVNLPASGVEYPVRVDNVRLIETAAAKQYKGSFVLDDLEVEVPSDIATPAAEAPLADRLIDADGDIEADWNFAALSDVQFTAAAPDLSRVAIAALKRIRTHNPDFVVLNGDIVDTGYAADVDLAKQTLEAGGCDLVESGAPGNPTANTVPCLYVPGNHESYGTDNLNAWKAVFGDPYRTFDHKGVRFVLLNSTRGTFRGSDYAQLPMLQEALATAEDDASVKRVVVFAHHPTNDPDPGDASQLGDRKEVQLIEKLLSESAKPAMMVGSHAQIVNVDRVEGVPYMVLPSSGKSPYGTPDRGGFTGWVRYGVSGDIKADVRAFAQSVTVTGPDALAAGSSATLGGELVQPNGVATGTRRVPLRYPMSVRWSGSGSLQLGGSVDDARRSGKVAVLNTTTRELTAVRAGEVTVTAEADSMRDGDDLAPITGSKTIVVAPYVAPPVEGGVGGTVPATLSLTLGTAPTFGAFQAGVERTYTASTAATVTSTAGEATLTVSGGHLSNGAFQLAQPLQVPGPKTWNAPVTNDTFALDFQQQIAANDPLRTGTYSRTLTFTLSTSTP